MLRALALNCSLKPSPAPSSTELMADQLLEALRAHDVEGEQLRLADYDIRPGVETDMGDGDQWPAIRAKLLVSDILIFATPTWMGHMSSIAARVQERLDAELAETDAEGRPSMAGKVAVVAIVGNEDGAHHITADGFQGLNDVGFSIPSQGAVYWNGEAMHKTDYLDLSETPKKVAETLQLVARNAAHLARIIKDAPYPVG